MFRTTQLRTKAMSSVKSCLATLGLLLIASTQVQAAPAKNVVLVHGAWADGSGWQGVYTLLKTKGYHVSIAQIPLTSLADDVTATERVLARQDGPTILVGHSYGGVVITEAGGAANVAGLVYVAAFVPAKGESLLAMIAGGAPPPLQPSKDGFLFFDPALFPQAFAGDLSAEQGTFMADAQVPVAHAAFNAPVTKVAWESKPSWYLLATDDHIVPAAAARAWAKRANASVVEVKASHAVFISRPADVAALIETAAKGSGGKAAK